MPLKISVSYQKLPTKHPKLHKKNTIQATDTNIALT